MKNNTFLSFIAFLLLISVSFIGCDDNKDANQSPTAVLRVAESTQVPGRVVMDGSLSSDSDGEIVSYTFRIDDLNGDTVAGPTTSFDVPEGSVASFYLAKGSYTAFLTVTDNNGKTSTAEDAISHDSDVVIVTASTTISALKAITRGDPPPPEGIILACGRYSGGSLVTCVLGSEVSTTDLDDILSGVKFIDSSINEDTVIWIQAWGAYGGTGSATLVGCSFISGCGGGAGLGGFAQTITTVQKFQDSTVGFGTSTIFYYLGKTGTHEDTGGQGGTSTFVTVKNLV